MDGAVNDNQQTNKGQPAGTNMDNARSEAFAPPVNNSRNRLAAQLGIAPDAAAQQQAPAATQELPRAGVRTDTQRAWWQQAQTAPDTKYIPGPAVKADNPLPGQFRERWNNNKTPGTLGAGATAADYKEAWRNRAGRTVQAEERAAQAQTIQNRAEDAATIERYRQPAQPAAAGDTQRPQGLPKPAQPVEQQPATGDQTRSVLVGQPTLAPPRELVGQPTLAQPAEQQLPNIAPVKAMDNTAPVQVQQAQRPLASFNDMVSQLDGQPLEQSGTVQQAEIATVNVLLSTTRGVSSTVESQAALEQTLIRNGWTAPVNFTAETFAQSTPDQFQQGDVIVTHMPGGQDGNSAVYIGNGHIFHYDAATKSMKVDSLGVFDKFDNMVLYRKAQAQAAVQVQAAEVQQTQTLVPIPDAGIQGTQTTVTADTTVVQQQQQAQPGWLRPRVELPPIKGIPADPEARIRQLVEQPPIEGTDVRFDRMSLNMRTMENHVITDYVKNANPYGASCLAAGYLVEQTYGIQSRPEIDPQTGQPKLKIADFRSTLLNNGWDETMAFPAGLSNCKAYFDRAMPGDIFIMGHTLENRHMHSNQGHVAMYVGRTPQGDHVIFHNNNETGKMCYESVNVLLSKTIDGDRNNNGAGGGYTAGWVYRRTAIVPDHLRGTVPRQEIQQIQQAPQAPAGKPCCTPSAPPAQNYYQQQQRQQQSGYQSGGYNSSGSYQRQTFSAGGGPR
ncbi:MAG: hypothetical protein K2W82_02190 [Candidatus Obscuribacterales bacterium]|nr:hypothetical protein [Candidatus Obscuribacterales bacterium]